jgi:hypothetical protein
MLGSNVDLGTRREELEIWNDVLICTARIEPNRTEMVEEK